MDQRIFGGLWYQEEIDLHDVTTQILVITDCLCLDVWTATGRLDSFTLGQLLLSDREKRFEEEEEEGRGIYNNEKERSREIYRRERKMIQ